MNSEDEPPTLDDAPAEDLSDHHRLFFASGDHLTPVRRGVYIATATLGTLLVFALTFFAVVEIVTHPRLSTWSIRIGVISALIAGVHVFRLAISTRPLGRGAWALFLVATGLLVYEIWATTNDPVGRVLFTATAVIGSTLLMVARAVCVDGISVHEVPKQ